MKAKLYNTLAESVNGLSCEELACRVLKSKNVSSTLGRRILEPILRDEANFVEEESGIWRIREPTDLTKRLLSSVTFVVVDLETTGDSVPEQGIAEIGAVKVRDSLCLEEFHALVNPERYIPPGVQRLAGLSGEALQSSPGIGGVMAEFARFCAHAVLVAHNAPFDVRILRREAKRSELPLPELSLCTCRLARRLLPGLASYRLGDLARGLGLLEEGSHRALSDALDTLRVISAGA
ncbi:MAG: PolC-type DNA polymerase III, partial [Nitrospinota bacterium]